MVLCHFAYPRRRRTPPHLRVPVATHPSWRYATAREYSGTGAGEATMHAKQIADIVVGLKGRQAFRRANTSELGAMRYAASPSLFVTREGETGKGWLEIDARTESEVVRVCAASTPGRRYWT